MAIRFSLGLSALMTAALVGCGGAPAQNSGAEEGASGTVGDAPAAPKVKREARDVFNAAGDAYAAGQLDRAVELLKEVLDMEPGLGAAYYNIGRVYEEKGQLDEAREWYDRAGEKAKGFGDGYNSTARLDLQKGDTASSEQLVAKALEVEPLNGHAHLNRAIKARLRKDYQAAVTEVRNALKEDSQNAEAYEVLARVYYDLGRFELARLVCETGLAIQKTAPLYNTLGLVYLKQDAVTKALDAFESALKVNANYVPAHLNLGSVTFGYRDYESSYRSFDAVVKLEPKNLEAVLSKAVAARAMERLDEAEAGYRQVLTADERHIGARFNLALLYQEHLQKPAEAITEYETVLRYESRDTELRRDVTQRIEACRIQVQNLKEMQEMMKKQPPAAPDTAPAGGQG